ncbi:parapinopsin-like [Oratosquilla oratoria]|uniref:parapinopsin-like n=1 Tax=Oratosquilla oratoria TaxID=337810 RepID=UPI003F771AAE
MERVPTTVPDLLLERPSYNESLSDDKMTEEGYVLSASFLVLIGVCGVFNNFAVIIIMATNKQLRTPLNLFLLNLAISDLGICVVGCPLSTLAAFNHGWHFGQTCCSIYAFLMCFFGITSIATLMVLSFERFLMISRPWKTTELSRKGALRIIAAIWAYSFVTTSPPLFGWGGFDIEGPGISCSIDWETKSLHNTSYIIFLFALGLIVPLSVMAFSYTNVLCTLKQAIRSGVSTGVAHAERRVAVMVVVMGITFLLAWTPYSVLALLIAFGQPHLVTPEAAAAPAIFAKSSCIYNPIIYVGLNTQFRSAWQRLMCCRNGAVDATATGVPTEKISLTVYTDPKQEAQTSTNIQMDVMSTYVKETKITVDKKRFVKGSLRYLCSTTTNTFRICADKTPEEDNKKKKTYESIPLEPVQGNVDNNTPSMDAPTKTES